jgi:hypothetical protein
MGGFVGTQPGPVQQPTSWGGSQTPGTFPTMPGTAAPYIGGSSPGVSAPPGAQQASPASFGKGFIPGPGQQPDPRAFFFSNFVYPFIAHMQAREGRAQGGGVEEGADDERIARAVALARKIMEGK